MKGITERPNDIGMVKLLWQGHSKVKDMALLHIGQGAMWILRGLDDVSGRQ